MVQTSLNVFPFQGAEQLVLTDSDKQGATSNLSSKQTSNLSTEQASNLSAKQASNMSAKQAAVEAVVNSVLSEALSNVASVHKPPAVEMVIMKAVLFYLIPCLEENKNKNTLGSEL